MLIKEADLKISYFRTKIVSDNEPSDEIGPFIFLPKHALRYIHENSNLSVALCGRLESNSGGTHRHGTKVGFDSLLGLHTSRCIHLPFRFAVLPECNNPRLNWCPVRYVIKNCMVALSWQGLSRLVWSPPSLISPMLVTTSLILKSNTFPCPRWTSFESQEKTHLNQNGNEIWCSTCQNHSKFCQNKLQYMNN